MKGKRTTHRKYKDSISTALGLTILQGQYLALLIDIDHAHDQTSRSDFQGAALRLREILPTDEKAIPAGLTNNVFFTS